MVNWRALERHLIRHGYLYECCNLAPLATSLLSKLAARWQQHCSQCFPRPLMASSPRQSTFPLEKHNHLKVLTDELARVGQLYSLTAPYGITVNRLHAATNRVMSNPASDLTDPAKKSTDPASNSPAGEKGYVELKESLIHADLCLCVCVPSHTADTWYRSIQRRRRIWWRELASDPGNFSLHQTSAQPSTTSSPPESCRSSSSHSSDLSQSAILFDNQLPVERMYLLNNNNNSNADSNNFKSRQSKQHQHIDKECAVLCSVVDVYSALWGVCGDALRAKVLHLSAQMAPVSLAVLATGNDTRKLQALTMHIRNKWQKSGASVYPGVSMRVCGDSRHAASTLGYSGDSGGEVEFSGGDEPDFEYFSDDDDEEISQPEATSDAEAALIQGERQKKDAAWLETMLAHLAGVGVCETIVVDDNTLRTGVCHVYSRDTALSRQAHVSSIA